MKRRLLPILTGLLLCVCLFGRGVPALAADLDEAQSDSLIVVFEEAEEGEEIAEAGDEEETLQSAGADSSAGIDMSMEKLTLVCGKSVKLKAYANKKNITSSVSWSSSSTKIAKVKKGKVTGVSCGTCVITAKYKGHTTKCTIQVKPGKVTLKSLKKSSASKVKVKWGKLSNITGYQLYRATSKNGIYSKIKTISSSKTCSYTNTVVRNKKYYYKIRAYYKDSKGNYFYGAWSEIKGITM